MNHTFDQQKAARVWQRVQQAQPEEKKTDRVGNLQELIANEQAAAAAYQQLARQMQSRDAAVLQRLSREEHSHEVCLRGMYILMTGEACEVHIMQPQKEPLDRILRRCYGLQLRSLKAYEARCDDPEYGHVFARIAEQEREHCMALLGLIGGLGKK